MTCASIVLFGLSSALFWAVLFERRLGVLKALIRITLGLVLLCAAGAAIEFILLLFRLSPDPVSTAVAVVAWIFGAILAAVPMAALIEQQRWMRWQEPPARGFEVLPTVDRGRDGPDNGA